MEEETLREKIARLLEEAGREGKALTAQQIAAILGLPPGSEKLVYEAIQHVAKSVRRRSGGRLAVYMVPPRCRKCGYEFKDLDRPRKPSRCPRCGSEWIEPPAFYIAEA